jgi:hypothetical protein
MPKKANRERLKPFTFVGTAVHRRGRWSTPTSIRVATPYCDRPDEYVCSVECPIFLRKPHLVRSIGPQYAYSLAFQLLRFMLSDFVLEDRAGEEVRLPRVRPYRRDIPLREAPETGYGRYGDAVDSTGRVRSHYVGVSVPKHKGDYVARVFYGSSQYPAKIMRGATASEAFYSGIDWIKARLDADGLVLLDIWNMPVEFPKRPKR